MPVVLCTTGLSKGQLETLKRASASAAVLRSANMSLGVNLLQLLFSSALTTQHFAIQLPLTTLALSAALFLFCRYIQQGKALLDDSRSII